MEWNESLFERCPFVNDCKGYDIEKRHNNQSDPSTDGCVVGTEGVICSQCTEGFNRDVATCMECQDDALYYRIGILLGVLFVLGLMVKACLKKLKKAWRKYR